MHPSIQRAMERKQQRERSLAYLIPFLNPSDTARKWIRRKSSVSEPYPISVWYRYLSHDTFMAITFPRYNAGPTVADVCIYKLPSEIDNIVRDHLIAMDTMAIFRQNYKIVESKKSFNELLNTLIIRFGGTPTHPTSNHETTNDNIARNHIHS